jgi:hypothetical protein
MFLKKEVIPMADSNKATEAAQNSVETAHNAVEQAEEHTTEQMLSQASRSLRHADAAVSQAYDSGDTAGASQANAQLEEERDKLE